MAFREVRAYAVRLSLSSGRGRVRLWLSEGSTDPETPDHEFDVSDTVLGAAAQLLQNDRNNKVFFDSSGNVLTSGVDVS